MTERPIGLDIWLAYCDKKQELEDANAEIERLRAVAIERASDEAKAHVYSVKMRQENDRLREALREIVEEPMTGEVPRQIARAALEGRDER